MRRLLASLVAASFVACASEAPTPAPVAPEVAPVAAAPGASSEPVPADTSPVRTDIPAAPPALERDQISVDGHLVVVHAKRPAQPWGAIVLVHGRTWSALPDFDLQVPGLRVSLMDNLAAEGLAVYAIDLRGYGSTARDPSGFTDPEQAADDLAAAVKHVAATHDLPAKPAVLGWSLGARVATLAALRHRDDIGALILYGSPCPRVNITVPPSKPKPPAMAPNTETAARSDFITPDALEPGVVEAFVAAALKHDPVKADWRDVPLVTDFSALRTPVMAIHGDRDPVVHPACLRENLARVPGGAHIEVLVGYDHAAHLERAAPRFVAAVVEFIRKQGRPAG